MVADLASRLEATIRARLDTARIAGRSGGETWWLDTATPYGPKLVTGPGDDDHWDREVESAIWTCTDEEDGCPEMARSVIAEGRHMAANDPAFIIRAGERDLRVLDRHRRKYGNESWCRGCRDGWPCREIADLVYAYDLDVWPVATSLNDAQDTLDKAVVDVGTGFVAERRETDDPEVRR